MYFTTSGYNPLCEDVERGGGSFIGYTYNKVKADYFIRL